MKKTIGIVGYKNGEANSFGAGIAYLQWISQFGNPRIIMPWEEFVEVDLLVLPGGLDLNPAAYGEIPGFRTTNQDVFKQFFYESRLKTYVESGTPIFGICLGHQQLCAYFGSKIEQDLTDHYYSNPRSELVHLANVYDNGVKRMKGAKEVTVRVNSLHHQAVYQHQLSKDLLMVLGAKDHKGIIVEAIMHKELPISGVQYHPEETNCGFAKSMVNMLLQEHMVKQ